MSPHQIPGLPDIYVMDDEWGGVWIEAKVAKPVRRPETHVFSAERDATGPQIDWLNDALYRDIGAWWLILDDDYWVIMGAERKTMTLGEWLSTRKPYGAEVDLA